MLVVFENNGVKSGTRVIIVVLGTLRRDLGGLVNRNFCQPLPDAVRDRLLTISINPRSLRYAPFRVTSPAWPVVPTG